MFLSQVSQNNPESSLVPAERDSNRLMICPELLIFMPSIWQQETSSETEDGKIITRWTQISLLSGVIGMKAASLECSSIRTEVPLISTRMVTTWDKLLSSLKSRKVISTHLSKLSACVKSLSSIPSSTHNIDLQCPNLSLPQSRLKRELLNKKRMGTEWLPMMKMKLP